MSRPTDIVQLLQGRSESEWQANPPASPQAIADLEHELGMSLPEDYRQLLLAANGGGINGPQASIYLESLEGVLLLSTDEVFEQTLQDVPIIGTDGSGNIYFFDLHNRLGYGIGALALVPMSAPVYTDAVFLAPTLTEAIRRVFAGDDFLKLLYPPEGG